MDSNNEVDILIVEDNITDAELTLRALKKNNLANRIFLVEDGEEALDFLFLRGKYVDRNKKNNPKVIFLDLKLPKIDGLEVLKVIKSDINLKNIPVVVLTSSNEESDIIESYQLGVNSYITKPIDFEKFMIAVKEIGFYWLLLNQAPIQ
jgi:CheY-like chemotaxis protein